MNAKAHSVMKFGKAFVHSFSAMQGVWWHSQ